MPPRRAIRRLRVVVTAGPTREYLDDVRFLSNGATGRLGIELAREARRRGCDVTLLLGPTELAPPPGVRTRRVVSGCVSRIPGRVERFAWVHWSRKLVGWSKRCGS